MQLNINQIKQFNRQDMADYFLIEDADEFVNYFDNCDDLYNWFLELHKEIEIEDLTEVLQLFVEYEKYEFYLTIKRFIANEL